MYLRMIFHRLLPALAALASLFVATAPAHAQANRLPGVAAAAVRLGIDPQVIEDLVTANRILAHEGVLDAYGHVSMRDPNRPDRFLIARPVAADLVTANDIIEYDLDSNPLSPTATQFIEIFIHGEMYKARPDVQAIVHTHSAAVIPFSVSTVPLRPVFHMAAFIAYGVPVWDPAESTDPDAAGMLVRNRALGASLAATLGDKPVVLLRGHGAVIVSRDLRSAVRNSIFVILNARMQEEAIALGGPVKYITAKEARTMFGSHGDTDRAWDYWKRRAFGSK